MRAFVLLLVLTFVLLGVEIWLSNFWHSDRSIARAQSDFKLGEKIYRENCAACHGEKGDGKGPEAQRLKTKPRDFTSGLYKFRSTPSGSLPLDDDIMKTISTGVRGTSMLAQLHLSLQERRAVIQYVKTFSPRFKMQKAANPIAFSPKPHESKELITLGETLYKDAGCVSCHGADGTGDGPSAEGFKDSWGFPIQPADLTLKPFKSGPEAEDLYRTLSTGLDGTPMPSYANVLAPRERWALVSYILSIATHERRRVMMGFVGEEVDGMHIDMRAAMAGMMDGGGRMMKDRMGK